VAVDPSPFVTLQDAGRFGWQRFGVSRAGAMDVAALALANALVGNTARTAALEFAHSAGIWAVEATSCRIAVTGGGFAVFVDETRVPVGASVALTRGQTLRVGGAPDAVWGYIAVAGGFEFPLVLGSLSTHARSAIGPFGRPLRADDVLPLTRDWVRVEPERTAVSAHGGGRGHLRVVMGPQDDSFTPSALGQFLESPFAVTHQMDRLGYRLAGPKLAHRIGFNIISDGFVPGCIQVPGSGDPIVLMRDAQPPGGYPKIATLISADIGRLAQSRPGTQVRFESVSVQTAQALHRTFLSTLDAIGQRVAPRSRARRLVTK
jgi:biotin-dependent carboxylase-like uncharacterized protein